MRVFWSETAINHLLAIYEYTAQNSRMYAERIVDQITRRSEQISDFPASGRTVPEYADVKIREVIEAPYRIIYRIGEDRIEILAVVHSAQRVSP